MAQISVAVGLEDLDECCASALELLSQIRQTIVWLSVDGARETRPLERFQSPNASTKFLS